MAFDIEMIKKVYENLPAKIAQARAELQKPLTLTEKILYSHLHKECTLQSFERGKSYVDFAPDRVAMQDATAQMALLQFMQAGKKKVAVPTTAHADHLIQARLGATKDLQESLNLNNEVFNFLGSVCNKYGCQPLLMHHYSQYLFHVDSQQPHLLMFQLLIQNDLKLSLSHT